MTSRLSLPLCNLIIIHVHTAVVEIVANNNLSVSSPGQILHLSAVEKVSGYSNLVVSFPVKMKLVLLDGCDYYYFH